MCAAEACCCKQEKLRRRWTLDAAKQKKETVGSQSRLAPRNRLSGRKKKDLFHPRRESEIDS